MPLQALLVNPLRLTCLIAGVLVLGSCSSLFAMQGLLTLMACVMAAAIVMIGNILTRLKAQELTLSQRETRLAATIDCSLDAVIVTASDGCIVEWNHGAEECFGLARDEALGKQYVDLILAERHQHEFRSVFSNPVSGNASSLGQRTTHYARHATGYEFPIEISLAVLETGHGLQHVIFARDVTSQELAQTELKAALRLAEAASQSKATFLAVMSHEMRTPLNGVIGSLELLSRTRLSAEQLNLVSTALESSDLVLSQISEVLDISKMEAGKLTLENGTFNLMETVQSVVDSVAAQSLGRDNRLSLRISRDVPETLVGDAMRLRQVLLNLLSNAVKFTRNGDISITVAKLGVEPEGLILEFAVTDTGIGIDPKRLGELFQDFSMIDSTYARRVGGTGLGLSISKRIVWAMGGRIGVASKEGTGSRFWFRIPLAVAAGNAPSPATVTSEAPDDDTAHPLTILLVEDNVTNQTVAQKLLSLEGHEVVTAANGLHAVEAANSRRFDVILMDISMPVIDGIEATRRIRGLIGPNRQTPIIAMTAHAVAGDREYFLSAGMSDYLTKPIRRATVLSALRRIVSEHPWHFGEPPSSVASEDILAPEILNSTEVQRLAREISPDLLPLIIAQFTVEIERRGGEFSRALADQDMDALRKAAHALAGLGATMGADRLADLMQRLEGRCAAHSSMEAWELARSAHALLAETSAAYGRYEAARDVAPSTSPASNPAGGRYTERASVRAGF